MLRNTQLKKGTVERYNLLISYYINGMTYEHVAEEYSCATITARRGIKEMLTELGLSLFGVDDIRMIY